MSLLTPQTFANLGPSTIHRIAGYAAVALVAAWVATTVGGCEADPPAEFPGDEPGDEKTLVVSVVGAGSVQVNDSPDECTQRCSYTSQDGFSLEPTGDFQEWVCYVVPSGGGDAGGIKMVSTADFGDEDSADCAAIFDEIGYTLDLTVDADDPASSARVILNPGQPPTALCERTGQLQSTLTGDCFCPPGQVCYLRAVRSDTEVTLTPSVGFGVSLVSGDCTLPTFTMNADKSCTVDVGRPTLSLDISGYGRIVSNPPGIDCQGLGPGEIDAGDCMAAFPLSSEVYLAVEVGVGGGLTSLACEAVPLPLGTPVTMAAARHCSASFEAALAPDESGVVELVSVGPAGENMSWVAGRADARSTIDISTDGSTVPFRAAVFLDPSNVQINYRRDVLADTTTVVGPTDTFANNTNLAVSGEGRFIAFMSDDPTLNVDVFGDAPPGVTRVFVLDSDTGVIAPVSASDPTTGVTVRDQAGSHAAISDNGRWVAFVGRRVPASGVFEQSFRVFIRDTCAGVLNCEPSTVIASTTTDGQVSTLNSFSNNSTTPTLSADGRFLAYTTLDNFAITDGASGGVAARYQILLRDRDADNDGAYDETDEQGGVTQIPIAIEQTPGGLGLSFPFPERPVISADGRFVVYREDAPELLAEVFSPIQLYDSCFGDASGSCTPGTTYTIRGSGVDARENINLDPDISADGRYVSMIGRHPTLNPSTVLVRDTCMGADPSCDPAGADGLRIPALNPLMTPVSALNSRISGDGRAVVFTSTGAGVTNDDQTTDPDIFLGQTGFVPDGPAGVIAIGSFEHEGDPLVAFPVLPPPAPGEPPGDLLVTVVGQGFTPSARVVWDGADKKTIYVGHGALQFRASQAELTAPGQVQIQVRDGAQTATATMNIQ